VASRRIGDNPQDMFIAGQASIRPPEHFTLRFQEAGGENAIPGDYLVRDQGSFGTTSGMWGLMRVQP
jgi:hypothetical protein